MLRASVLFLALVALPAFARAQAPADADAPGQSVRSDGAVGHAWVSLRSDVVSPFFGVWGATLDVAPVAWLSVGATPSYVSRDSGNGLAGELTLRAWPLQHGLDGPFVGAMVGALRTTLDDAATLALSAGADAGWQLVWSGMTVTLSGGAAWTGVVDGPAQGLEGWSPRVRVELGATWR